MTVIGRIDRGESRWYVDPVDPELVYESVTAILSAATSKPWLTAWASKLAAEFSVDHLDLIRTTRDEVGRDAAVDLIKGAAKRKRELLADIGTHQHDVLEALLLDQPIPSVPEHLDGVEVEGETVDHDAISDGLLNFLTDYDFTPEMAEATVANVVHGFAGTLDMIGRFPRLRLDGIRPRAGGLRGLIDCKSGKTLDPTMNAQLGAYERADEVWLDSLGNKAPMPAVDFCAVLHLRREYERGYKLLRVPADEDAFEWFLYCQKVLKKQKAQPKIKGRPLYPPLADGSQPPPLLEDVEHDGFGRCRGALLTTGLRSLSDLAGLTEAQCLAIKGIGPKAVVACAGVLSAHGLAFAAPVQKGEVA